VALETTAKLAVNVVLSAAAVSGLVKLLPYQWSQQEKLKSNRSQGGKGRVNHCGRTLTATSIRRKKVLCKSKVTELIPVNVDHLAR